MNDYSQHFDAGAERSRPRGERVRPREPRPDAARSRVYWNLPEPALYEEAVFRREGRVAADGPFVVSTGKHTARAAADKFITREATTEEKVWWGEYNRPFTPANFNTLLTRLQGYLQGRDVFVQDCFAGADPDHRLPVRIITENAWHSLFARTMFAQAEEPGRRIASTCRSSPSSARPDFQASPVIDSTRSETFIIVNFAERLAIIGGSSYAGEIKKTIFTVLNFLLPLDGVLSMHCSANVGARRRRRRSSSGSPAPARPRSPPIPTRQLIGDDEHGWSDNGVFNFEDGCYAKVIRLSPDAEPQIYASTRRFGTILENVTLDPLTRRLDLNDASVTENTRGAYPLALHRQRAAGEDGAGTRRTSSS